MPKFTIDHPNKHNVEDAFKKVKILLTDGDDLKKYDSSLKCEFDDKKMTCHIKGSQFKAELNVTSKGTGSQVSITVDLPLLLTPFKSKVQDSLSRMLGKHLG